MEQPLAVERHGFEVTFTPAAAALREVRNGLREWLDGAGVTDSVATDLVSAASELCTNAIQAARIQVSLRGRLDGDTVILEVRDDGPGFGAAVPETEPDPFADAGRGLFLTKQLVDVLWVGPDPDRGGTVARCGRRV